MPFVDKLINESLTHLPLKQVKRIHIGDGINEFGPEIAQSKRNLESLFVKIETLALESFLLGLLYRHLQQDI